MTGLQLKTAAIVSAACWRRCGQRVPLEMLENGEVRCLDPEDRLIYNQHGFWEEGDYAAICKKCLTEFAPASEITSAAFELCFRCRRNFILVLKNRSREYGVIGGKATVGEVGNLPLLSDIICNDCLKRLGFWGRLLRAARIELALAMG